MWFKTSKLKKEFRQVGCRAGLDAEIAGGLLAIDPTEGRLHLHVVFGLYSQV